MARARQAALDDGLSFGAHSDMEFTVRTLSEAPGLRERFPEFHRLAWPRFLHEGDGTGGLWPRIYSEFADFQFGLCDDAGTLVAVGDSILCLCYGSDGGLPPDIKEGLAPGLGVEH